MPIYLRNYMLQIILLCEIDTQSQSKWIHILVTHYLSSEMQAYDIENDTLSDRFISNQVDMKYCSTGAEFLAVYQFIINLATMQNM